MSEIEKKEKERIIKDIRLMLGSPNLDFLFKLKMFELVFLHGRLLYLLEAKKMEFGEYGRKKHSTKKSVNPFE